MAKEYNVKILNLLEKEILQEIKNGKQLDAKDCEIIYGKSIAKESATKYKNLVEMHDILNFGEMEFNQLFIYGNMAIPMKEYHRFVKLLHDPKTGIPIPKALLEYGTIPGTKIPVPLTPPDNKTIDQMEMFYIQYYNQFGISPQYDQSGLRKPYPHEKIRWNKDGSIAEVDSEYVNNYYRRYVALWNNKRNKKEKPVNSETSNNINNYHINNEKRKEKPKAKKGMKYKICKKQKATADQIKRMLASVGDKAKSIDMKKLRNVLIVIGVVTALSIVSYATKGQILSGTLKALTGLAVGGTLIGVGINSALKKKKKKDGDKDQKNDQPTMENEGSSKELLNTLKQKLVENVKQIKQLDAQINVINNNKQGKTADQIEADLLIIQRKREKLTQIQHDLLDQISNMTEVPDMEYDYNKGGMSR